MRCRLVVIATCLWLLTAGPASAVVLNWGSLAAASGSVNNPGQAAGAPDNLAANLLPGPPPGSLTLDFPGPAIRYDSDDLAALLGVGRGLLQGADLLAFERNPNPMGFTGFEGSLWHFDDGSNTFDFTWPAGSPPIGPVVAVGSVDRLPYAAFFGLTPLAFDTGFGFLLFDLDVIGIDASRASFRVTIANDPSAVFPFNSPDPEAVGRLTAVPEPASLTLLATGLLALRLRFRRAS